MPSILGAVILLFGNSFAAYATAYSLTGTGLSLVPILIGYDLSGNVLSNPHEGQALAFGMFVVLAAMMLFYVRSNGARRGGRGETAADRSLGRRVAGARRRVVPDPAVRYLRHQPQGSADGQMLHLSAYSESCTMGSSGRRSRSPSGSPSRRSWSG